MIRQDNRWKTRPMVSRPIVRMFCTEYASRAILKTVDYEYQYGGLPRRRTVSGHEICLTDDSSIGLLRRSCIANQALKTHKPRATYGITNQLHPSSLHCFLSCHIQQLSALLISVVLLVGCQLNEIVLFHEMNGVGFLGGVSQHGSKTFLGILHVRFVIAANPIAQGAVVRVTARVKLPLVFVGDCLDFLDETIVEGLLCKGLTSIDRV